MSETAESIIKSALEEILVQAAESPIEPDEAQGAIKYLNRMMAGFSASGINLGYTVVANLGDAITVPDGAIDGIISNLAVRLSPQYSSPGTPVDPLLVKAAQDGRTTMLNIAFTGVGESTRPDTMPIGSGNEDYFGGCNNKFFPSSADALAGEQGGVLSPED